MPKISKMKRIGISSKTIIVTISVIVSFSLLISFASQENPFQSESFSYDGVPRAAILDQLHSDIPNVKFQEEATKYLKTAGYEVDLFTTEQLTVNFFKKLPKMNYEFIVFRTHAVGDDGPNYSEEDPVAIFTGEKYADDKYIQEQLFGQLRKGAPFMSSEVAVSVDLSGLDSTQTGEEFVAESSWSLVDNSNPYFMIGSKYVDELMEGSFPNSVLVLGGCSTLSNPSLANSLINRGASSVVGWDRLVGASRNDSVMLAFLENVLIDNMEVEDAVKSVVKKYNLDSDERPTFSYYDQST